MKALFITILMFVMLIGNCQLVIHPGTTMVVNSGTQVEFKSADTLIINSGSYLINDGQIKLKFPYYIHEDSGYPIRGNGFEEISFVSDSINRINPGNLGFSFFNWNNNDSITLKRYHDSLTIVPFSTVRRLFYFRNHNNVFNKIKNVNFNIDTSEYSKENIIDWGVISSDSVFYNIYFPDSASMSLVYSSDTISNYSVYTLSPIKSSLSSNSISSVCLGDTLKLDIMFNGPFMDSTAWVAQLIDSTTSNILLTDTCLYINHLFNFIFPTQNILPSSNLYVDIIDTITGYKFTVSSFQIYELPPTPIISIMYDTLFSQNYSNGNIQWYFNNLLLNGEVDSSLIVGNNGLFGVEFISNEGCVSFADTIFSTLSLNNQNKSDISIYPNPIVEFLFIENSGNPQEVSIYTTNGQVVKTYLITSGKNKINLRNLPNGNYILNINENNFIITKIE